MEFFGRQGFLPVSADDEGILFSLRAVDGEWRRFDFQVVQGRLPSAPGEVALAPGAMDELGAAPGDRLALRIAGHPLTVTVVGEYLDPFNLGFLGMTTLETARSAWPDATVDSLLVKLKPEADAEAFRAELLAATDFRAGVSLARTFLLPPPILEMMERVRTLSMGREDTDG